jgi:hypothetical protein
MKTEFVKVLRPFVLDSKPTKVGDVIEVPSLLAVELRTAKKAEKTDPPVRAPRVESAPESKAAQPQKGVK